MSSTTPRGAPPGDGASPKPDGQANESPPRPDDEAGSAISSPHRGIPIMHHGALPDIAPLPRPVGDSEDRDVVSVPKIERSTSLVELPPKQVATLPSGAQFGRRFGRILPENSRRPSEDALEALALAIGAASEAKETPETEADSEENTDIDAGYTYLGQFLDHDLTFDPVSALKKPTDPGDTTNFRTPRLDLDSLYGAGPQDQPFMYDARGVKLAEGINLDTSLAAVDLPRAPNGRAILGDPRNDENFIVAQLVATMIQFHNKVVDKMVEKMAPNLDNPKNAVDVFEQARRQVRWHYQYAVVNDFLKTIVDHSIVDDVLAHGNKLFELAGRQPFIPIEFAAAAYRFGHSMVRPSYRMNAAQEAREVIFPNLAGFRVIPQERAIDWRFFFRINPEMDPTTAPPSPGGSRQQKTKAQKRPVKPLQKAYKIDTSVTFPMTTLPEQVAPPPSSIAERNLLRSRQFALATAQQAAAVMMKWGLPFDETVLKAVQDASKPGIPVGKADQDFAKLPRILGALEEKKDTDPRIPLLLTRLPALARELKAHTPLWYYVLLEAQRGFVPKADTSSGIVQNAGKPVRLRGIGGRIVAEVFIGLLRADPTSYLREPPGDWTPKKGVFGAGEAFGFKDLILIARPNLATLPVP